MSFSPGLNSNFNNTKMRSEQCSSLNGMCSLCSADCIGTCELGLSAVLGTQAVYPTTTGNNQIASEKNYPFDYSHFNINGRVFGAVGSEEDTEKATVFHVNLEQTIGSINPVKLALPIMLPALIKLNWPDYFAGAAMAGTICVIGEGAPSKDSNAKFENGKITSFPMLRTILDSFLQYYRGYGQIVLQCNCEDDSQGLPELAITKYGLEGLEFKFGQSAKGTQPVNFIGDYETALKKQQQGALIYPDPSSEEMKKANNAGVCPNFYQYGRLPMWDENFFQTRITHLRQLGLKNVYFKMAGYDPIDIERVLRIGAQNQVDMVTFDGAGGGSGYSPCKMMNEWGLPTVDLQVTVYQIAKKLKEEGLTLPAICITGGFATEDQAYKALALGAPFVNVVGICRGAMAAANSAKVVGELLEKGTVPQHLMAYGTFKGEIFADLPDLWALYGKKADDFSCGAIGTFSYLNRLAFGLKHFGALNRKFNLKYFDQTDLIPLTLQAQQILQQVTDNKKSVWIY